MWNWSQYLENTFCTGAAASITTSLMASLCARLERHAPLQPINAVSHIVWGDDAAAQEDFSVQHTVVGVVLNTAAAMSWASLYELWVESSLQPIDAEEACLRGIVVAAIAYVVDYHVVPSRLTPGFEKCLSGSSLLAIYASLALGLAVGKVCQDRQSSSSA